MINSSLFFLKQCKSLDWSDCLIVLLLSATHFRKSGHARLIRGCFSFSQCFRAGVFSSLSPPPLCSLWLAPSPPLFWKFQHGAFASKLRAQRKRLHCRLAMFWSFHPLADKTNKEHLPKPFFNCKVIRKSIAVAYEGRLCSVSLFKCHVFRYQCRCQMLRAQFIWPTSIFSYRYPYIVKRLGYKN